MEAAAKNDAVDGWKFTKSTKTTHELEGETPSTLKVVIICVSVIVVLILIIVIIVVSSTFIITIKHASCPTQGCQMSKLDPYISLDCARVEGLGAQSKERKGSNFAA